MRFYLGAYRPHWLASATFPLFISHHTLRIRKSLPRACVPWALDSGAFTALSSVGGFSETATEYALRVRVYRCEIGNLEWAAPQDWMCEPFILAKTGLGLHEHQRRTVANYLRLKEIEPSLPFIPVLQGWTLDDYLRCRDMYDHEWIDLTKEHRVGLGSVCRRQNMTEAQAIIERLHSEGIRLHAFGFKLQGLRRVAHLLESADSMAWSYDGRRAPPLPGHTHQHCNNCLDWARQWHGKALGAIAEPKQWAMVMR